MLKEFIADESGQGMVEYGLILALIAVVVIGAVTLIGGNLNTMFGKAANTLSSSNTNASTN